VNAVNRALKFALPGLSAGLKPLLSKCAGSNCRPHSRFLSFSFRSEGTYIDGNWYCGPDCFEEAARNRIATLCTGRKFGVETRRPRLSLGLTALSLGHITPEQLKTALAQQRRNSEEIGETLIVLGYLNQAQLTTCIAAQWGHPVLSLQNRRLNVPLRIPMRLMELYSMLPVHFVSQTNKLVIGFSESVDYRILSTIETMLDCTVVPCFIARDEFESHFQAARLQSSNDEVLFDRRSSTQEMARIARNYASQIGAASVSFGVCCDYLWSRLRGPQVSVDVLARI
jgi:hypothetical protein